MQFFLGTSVILFTFASKTDGSVRIGLQSMDSLQNSNSILKLLHIMN